MDNAEERWKESQRSVPGNLDKLAEMVNTRIAAGPAMPKAVPTKGCPVCGKLYDKQVLKTRPDPRLWLCADCMGHMKGKETAFVCIDKRFCFAVINCGTRDLENAVITDVSVPDFEKLLARQHGNTSPTS